MSDAPDKDCYTLPNGECVAPNCSLHGPLIQELVCGDCGSDYIVPRAQFDGSAC